MAMCSLLVLLMHGCFGCSLATRRPLLGLKLTQEVEGHKTLRRKGKYAEFALSAARAATLGLRTTRCVAMLVGGIAAVSGCNRYGCGLPVERQFTVPV